MYASCVCVSRWRDHTIMCVLLNHNYATVHNVRFVRFIEHNMRFTVTAQYSPNPMHGTRKLTHTWMNEIKRNCWRFSRHFLLSSLWEPTHTHKYHFERRSTINFPTVSFPYEVHYFELIRLNENPYWSIINHVGGNCSTKKTLFVFFVRAVDSSMKVRVKYVYCFLTFFRTF